MEKEIGFRQALLLTLSAIGPVGTERVLLDRLNGRIIARDIFSVVDSPSVDASLKDGYAVISEDVVCADIDNPVRLRVIGSAVAGGSSSLKLSKGHAARITTGAKLPQGADAVLAEEFTARDGDTVLCYNTAHPGRNVLARGTDIRKGEVVARVADMVTPPLAGLLATAGIDVAEVYTNPTVCVLATGDEVVAPGRPLPEGKLYASNITEICAWLSGYRIPYRVAFAGDSAQEIRDAVTGNLEHVDAFISSGGAWGSERDLMTGVLESMGWEGIYHRVRMGPGKAVAFGLLEGKPFFCLPGGPPSNEMAFLQIALPGIMKMRGHAVLPFPVVSARLASTVKGVSDWTQFIHAELMRRGEGFQVVPLKSKSRLQGMAGKNAIISIPEGTGVLHEGELVQTQVLDIHLMHEPFPDNVCKR